MNIIQYPLSNDAYFSQIKVKTQVYFHHTAGSPNPYNVVNGWNLKKDKICTSYVIAGREDGKKQYKEGDIIQCFPENQWGYHLGLNSNHFKKFNVPYVDLNQTSIGIEICNFGPLTKKEDGKFYTYINTIIPENEVIELETPFKGFEYYHAYSDKQIESTRELLIEVCDKYQIDKTYHEDIWDLTERAYKGENGIFTHVSVRTDKYDCSPQPKLIEMLKSL